MTAPTPEQVPTAEQARKHMDALAPYVLPKGEEHWEPVYAYLEHLIAENATLRQQAAQLAEAQAREARLRAVVSELDYALTAGCLEALDHTGALALSKLASLKGESQ